MPLILTGRVLSITYLSYLWEEEKTDRYFW